MRVLIATLVLALVGFAGCTEDDDAASEASVAFDTDGDNQDGVQSESANCSDGGTLNGVGSIDHGSLQVTVSDGEGNEVFTNSYSDPVDLEGELIDGADGDWQLKAERQGGFDGDYSFTLLCT